MKRALPYAAAAASGAAMALALPLAIPLVSLRELDPAGRLEPLALVALVPAILAVRVAPSLRAALLRGLVAGLAYFYAAIWWVSHAMTAFGGLSFGFSFVALSLLVALHGGALGGGVRRLLRAARAARLAARPAPPARVGGPRARPQLPALRLPLGEPRLHAGAHARGSRSSPRSGACTRSRRSSCS